MAKIQPVVVKHVQFDEAPQRVVGASLGNQDPHTRLFSKRADVQPHFHKPGRYYCGRCMFHVAV